MTTLPTGTVTFLFTDIEGSTRLLEQLKDAYAGVLAECRRLVRTAVQERGGQEVDTDGDAVFAAFPIARGALVAAVTAQQRILRHPWPDGATVRIRMGLHTGEARVAEGGYVGMDVHRAARICAARWVAFEGLVGLASVSNAHGHPGRAARLYGAAETLREAISHRPTPQYQEAYDRRLAATRRGLGESAFAAAWADGLAMTLEQAIEYALAQETG